MNFAREESRRELRGLIAGLAEKMHERGDPWVLKDCTSREDSWYHRHWRQQQKKKEKENAEEKKETVEKK